MSYIGSTPVTQSFISGTDYFNGTGATVAFTLSRAVNSVNDIEVMVNNVAQTPSSYSAGGTTLTFSAAPSAGTSNIYVRYLSTTLLAVTVGQISPGNVSDQPNPSTGSFSVPSGTTAQRPAGAPGMVRHNTTTGLLEFWDSTNNLWTGVGEFIATGGSIVTSGGYRIHTFTSSGTFQVQSGSKSLAYLVVAGGGAGGTNAGAGGGAGGLIYQANTLTSTGAYAVVVGSGGANGGTSAAATGSGANSTFQGYTALGGGGGINDNGKGAPGGSGGGSSAANTGADGTSGQGNKGAGVAGQNVQSNSVAGEGGNGTAYSISGTSTFYAGGGGGAAHTGDLIRIGGLGGGGNSGRSNYTSGGTAGQNGVANSGGGGGAGSGGGFIGGNGGSGIVIIRYAI
jgi:hypothetical protein